MFPCVAQMSYVSAWKSMLGNLDEVGGHYFEELQGTASSKGKQM